MEFVLLVESNYFLFFHRDVFYLFNEMCFINAMLYFFMWLLQLRSVSPSNFDGRLLGILVTSLYPFYSVKSFIPFCFLFHI